MNTLLAVPDKRELRIADGRTLAWCEYGRPDGRPVLFFHGWPGSRLDFAPNDKAADQAGLRVVAVDRPGIGGSSPQRARRVLDWPRDIAELADALGLGEFAVLGFSFGGPYARACAYALPERVTATALVSSLGALDTRDAKRGMPPPTRYGLGAARVSPLLAMPVSWSTARAARQGKIIDRLSRSMSETDAEVLERPEVRDGLAGSLVESFAQGSAAATWDGVAVARGEGCRLEEINGEVRIWHGEEDRNDPVEMARSQEQRIPNAHLTTYPGEGHLIFFSRIGEILAELAEVLGARPERSA